MGSRDERTPVAAGGDRWLRPAALALVAAVAAVYARSLGFEWLDWDDQAYLLANPDIGRGLGWGGLRWAATTGYFGSWHPLTWLSYLGEFQLFGRNPAGYHAVSAALHAVNALLLLGALRALTGRAAESALVAALFALHPLRVESVAWVSERKDLLSSAFGFACLWAWGAYARRPGPARLLGALALAAASLLSKPMLVTLPFLLLVLDAWPLQRFGRRRTASLLLEKLPFAALAAGAGAAILSFQSDIAPQLSPGQRLAHALCSYVFYLGKTLWPLSLSGFYPHPYLPRTGGVAWAAWQVAAAAALLCALTGAAWACRRSRGYWLSGWLWFLGTLVPVIGLVQVGKQGYADRYTYFPQVGLLLAACFGLGDWLRARRDPARAARLAATAAAAVLLALAGLSWAQAGVWRDSISLFSRGVELDPRNAVFRYDLARALQLAGRGDEALDHYRGVLEVDPGHIGAMNNLATLLDVRGRSAEAESLFQRALELEPDSADAHYNFANHLSRRGQNDDALREYRRAIALDPRHVRARLNLGHLLRQLGRPQAARAQYQRVLEVQPENAAAKRGLEELR